MPFLWVSGVVADMFAGERERHTLEALLATRLSDQAILFGKLLAAMTYGFTLTWVIMIASLITVNIGFGKGELLFYPLDMTLAALVFSILISGLSGCYRRIGVAAGGERPSGATVDEYRYAGLVPAVHVDPVHPKIVAGCGRQSRWKTPSRCRSRSGWLCFCLWSN
ncbi:MAG: ABC transporter permease subunit [Bacillus subtilis]|nr:ABC transporter permease subunit [Bacillus subtilis]